MKALPLDTYYYLIYNKFCLLNIYNFCDGLFRYYCVLNKVDKSKNKNLVYKVLQATRIMSSF